MRGEKGSETAYSEDPVSVATDWVSLGAEQLHVVDLDAAFGEPSQRDVIAAIVRSVDVPVQVGGGVRSPDDFRELLALGVGTVVFGTAAVEAPEVVEHAIDLAREKVVLAVDVKDARVAVRGWTETSSEEPVNFGLRWQGRGVTTFVYTDTARDGAMVGPNIDATLSFAERTGAAVIASGGIGTLDHVRALGKSGTVAGAILGKALYEEAFTLKDALAAARQ